VRPIVTGVARSVVRMSACLSAGKTASTAKAAEPIEISFEGGRLVWAQETIIKKGQHIDATWRIRLNDPLRRCGLISHLFDHLQWRIQGVSRVSRHPPFCLGAIFEKNIFCQHVVTVFS